MPIPARTSHLIRPPYAAWASALLAALLLGTLLVASLSTPDRVRAATEGCPSGTTLMTTFEWNGTSWASGGPDGIALTGDDSAAFWTSQTKITAVVITAGSVTLNFVYDPLETAGEIRPSDVQGADGPLSALGFCSGNGAVPSPTSGSSISVGVTKTASCATTNPDGTMTVTGSITIVRHSPAGSTTPVRIRIRVARDTVYAVGDHALSRSAVSGLQGAILEQTASSLVQPYTVTFAPGKATTFQNKIEIVIEEANTGLERHKYFSDRASFAACAPTQSPEQSVAGATGTPGASASQSGGEGAVAAATGGPGGTLPNTSVSQQKGSGSPLIPVLWALVLSSLAGLLMLRLRGDRQR